VKVYVKGEPEVSLGKSQYVAEGGEGKVFARGDTGYKIYHDASKAIPIGKIQALAAIQAHDVIKPTAALYTGKKAKHVGHTFRFVRDTWTLCQLFPRAFREREGLEHENTIKLMRRIQEGVEAVHQAGVLLVDLNEMNFLVSRDFSTPYFIDVDSYQTPQYPATAIMPSVRDPLVRNLDFTELSDWFSFAIVSFTLLTGIHPFKGKHPSIKGLEQRMAAGVSIFDKDVKIPKVAYGLDVVPDIYKDWYRALFVDKHRLPPPDDLQGVIVLRTVVRKITGTDNFDVTEIAEFDDDIRAVFSGGGHVVVHAGPDMFIDRRKTGSWQRAVSVGFTPKHGHPVAALTDKYLTNLGLFDLADNDTIPVTLRADDVMVSGETIYVKSRDKILEVTFTETASRVVAGTRLAANVLENASKLYEGVVLQSLLGEPHASLFPRPGACYQKTLPELKGHKIVEAKHDAGVLMVVAAEGGTYHRFVFRFDADYSRYDLRKVEDVTPTGLNFVTLDSGVCVCLNEDEQLELFSNKIGSKSVKTIDDPTLGGDMRLTKHHGQVRFSRGAKLYGMKMK
jgi:hypothetical protein